MTVYHKPSPITQMMNKILGAAASAGITPGHMVSIEVKGRRSGEVRFTIINTVDYNGQRYLVSPRGEAQWVRNVRAAGGQATIRHGGRTPVRLEELPAGERAPVLQSYLRKNAMATKAHFGIDPKAPLEEFQRIAAQHPVFRVVETA